MNKRGQEGYTLVQWMLALLVLAVIGYIIYYAYMQYTATAQYVPDDLSKLAVACDINSRLGDYGKVEYCITPRAIKYGSATRYVNCEFPKVKDFITDLTLKDSCKDSKKTMCAKLKVDLGNNYGDGSKVYVNDIDCKTISLPA